MIAARWAAYAEGEGVGAAELNNVRRFVDGDTKQNRAELERLLGQTIDAITVTGRRVTILGPVPELPYNLASMAIRDIMHGRVRDYAVPRQDFDKRQAFVLRMLADLEKRPGVRVLYPHKILCDGTACRTMDNGEPLYVDDNHLSLKGIQVVKEMLNKALLQ